MAKLRARPQTENANRHSPYGLGLLETSIGRDGWIDAITVAADDESISGSARIETGAAKGWDFAHEEPVVIQAPKDRPIVVETDGSQPVINRRVDIPTASDPRARRLSVAANQITAVDWVPDASVLAGWVETDDAIKGLFTDDSWAELLAGVGEPPDIGGGGNDDAPPAIDEDRPTRVQPGDVWRVGEHIVACLDSTDRANIEKWAGRVTFLVADPPYGIEAVDVNKGTLNSGNPYPFGGLKGSVGSGNPIAATQYAPVIGDTSTDTAIEAALLMLDMFPKAVQFWWGANHYANALPPSSCWVVWDKREDVASNDFADGELAWCNQKLAIRIFRHLWSGLMKASERGERRVHPTQKPVALFLFLYERYGKPGDLILDPFLGSGPSLKAAHRMGDRRVVGFELSPHYCDHVLSWAEAAGLTCTRVGE